MREWCVPARQQREPTTTVRSSWSRLTTPINARCTADGDAMCRTYRNDAKQDSRPPASGDILPARNCGLGDSNATEQDVASIGRTWRSSHASSERKVTHLLFQRGWTLVVTARQVSVTEEVAGPIDRSPSRRVTLHRRCAER